MSYTKSVNTIINQLEIAMKSKGKGKCMGMDMKKVPKNRGEKKPVKSVKANQVPKTKRAKRDDDPYLKTIIK